MRDIEPPKAGQPGERREVAHRRATDLDHLETRQLAQRLEIVEGVHEAPVRVRPHEPQLAQVCEAAQRLEVKAGAHVAAASNMATLAVTAALSQQLEGAPATALPAGGGDTNAL